MSIGNIPATRGVVNNGSQRSSSLMASNFYSALAERVFCKALTVPWGFCCHNGDISPDGEVCHEGEMCHKGGICHDGDSCMGA